jgi:ABC-type glutathione transport system ATPase component
MASNSHPEEASSSAPNEGDSLHISALEECAIDMDNDLAMGGKDADPHNPHISFRRVEAVNVSVRKVGISVRKPTVSRLWKSNKSEEEESHETKILDNVSADMPAGQVMAIIGGSGSGKVCRRFCLPLVRSRRLTRVDVIAEYHGAPNARPESPNFRFYHFQRVA